MNLVTRAVAAAALGVTERWIRGRCEMRQIKTYTVERSRIAMVDLDEVRALFRVREDGPTVPKAARPTAREREEAAWRKVGVVFDEPKRARKRGQS